MDKIIYDVRAKMIKDLMSDRKYKPMRFKELCVILRVPKEERESFKEMLDQMISGGEIMMKENGRYKLSDPANFTGVFCGSTRGFGFVSVEGMTEDIFIPADETMNAFHGDTVIVKVVSSSVKGRRAEGKILQIVSRGIQQAIGVFQKNKNFGFVVPDNQKLGNDFFIPSGKTMDAGDGDKVVIEITGYGSKAKNPEGKIIEILGQADNPETDVISVLRAFEITKEFPQAVISELQAVPSYVREEDYDGRQDYRSLMTVTIDGEDAKDLDDAITIEKTAEGYRLGVHIADVSHYVTEGSPLDKEALRRATSVYLIDTVVPMLPKQLSNGICSLNEGTDRLALSCMMEIDSRGRMISHEVTESVICVNHRMSYTQVSVILDGGNAELLETYADAVSMFKDMKVLSDLLREVRRKRGSIDFDFPESKIILDEHHFPVDIHPYDRNPATKIIEDFMLMANETIAEDYFWQELPFLYRTHEAPDEEKIRRLMMFIKNYGYFIHTGSEDIHPKEFQKLLGKVEGTPEEALISRLTLRSMKQAKYTTENVGHFGLAVKYYCHFTSPIRRYPDLQIHRIIKENIHGRLGDSLQLHYRQLLPDVALQSSSMERRADEAERDIVKKKKTEYMSRRIGQQYDGVVSGVTNWGMYVELPNTCEGLVRLADIESDYYEFDEVTYSLKGLDFGREYKLGQTVHIQVLDVDFISKTVYFKLVED